MRDPILVEVTDEHGTSRLILDTAIVRDLPPRKRALLDELAASLVDGLTQVTGFKDTARKVAVAELTRQIADHDAYERVCERRGLLPL